MQRERRTMILPSEAFPRECRRWPAVAGVLFARGEEGGEGGGGGKEGIGRDSFGGGLFEMFVKPLFAFFGATEEVESPEDDGKRDVSREDNDSKVSHCGVL
jgi:hypothetical protein